MRLPEDWTPLEWVELAKVLTELEGRDVTVQEARRRLVDKLDPTAVDHERWVREHYRETRP